MEDFTRIFRSSTGDVYYIILSEEHAVLSSEIVDMLNDVDVVSIELRRLAGKNVTGQEVLSAIASTIAEFFVENENAILCYYCDFVDPIPHTYKNSMPPQEYRSRLFEKMFLRYSKKHEITDVRLSVVEINGINEKYFFHVIYREAHSLLASMIGHDLKSGFDK